MSSSGERLGTAESSDAIYHQGQEPDPPAGQFSRTVLRELSNIVHCPLECFLERYFGSLKGLSNLADKVLHQCKNGNPQLFGEEKGWYPFVMPFVDNPQLDEITENFQKLQLQLLRVAKSCGMTPVEPRSWTTARHNFIQEGLESTLDMSFACSGPHEKSTSWETVLIPVKVNKATIVEDLAHFMRMVRQTFFEQETRRFVLAFSLHGLILRLWHFDRAGIVSTHPIHIVTTPKDFVQVMLGIHLLGRADLGLDPAFKNYRKGGRYLDYRLPKKTERFVLEKCIWTHRDIQSRGTTCWKAYIKGLEEKSFVIKDSWHHPEDSEEWMRFKDLETHKNVVEYHGAQKFCISSRIDNIDEVRGRLTKVEQYRPYYTEPPRRSLPQLRSLNLPIPGSTFVSSSSRTSQNPLEGSSNNQESQNEPPSTTEGDVTPQNAPVGVFMPVNLVHRRMIVSPVGKRLIFASSPSAILTALIGAVRGHLHLVRSNVLHGNISLSNILLIDDEQEGMLIDLSHAFSILDPSDTACLRSVKSDSETHFMAIATLRNEAHGWKQDLESIWWVLFWICMHWNGPGPTPLSDLDLTKEEILAAESERMEQKTYYSHWPLLSNRDLLSAKTDIAMYEGIRFFEIVQRDIRPFCKPLAPVLCALRDLLLPAMPGSFDKWEEKYVEMLELLRLGKDEIRKKWWQDGEDEDVIMEKVAEIGESGEMADEIGDIGESGEILEKINAEAEEVYEDWFEFVGECGKVMEGVNAEVKEGYEDWFEFVDFPGGQEKLQETEDGDAILKEVATLGEQHEADMSKEVHGGNVPTVPVPENWWDTVGLIGFGDEQQDENGECKEVPSMFEID